MPSPRRSLTDWVEHLSTVEIPVLKHTLRQLHAAHEDIDRINANDISTIVLRDPMMTVRVMAYIHPLGGQRLHGEITTIRGAVAMVGIHPFFARFENALTVEESLKSHPDALLGLLHVVRRAQRAAGYAYNWALWRHDIDLEEVSTAALLHDLAETLLWCFAPESMLEIQHQQSLTPALRSVSAQEQVLGFPIQDLQIALCQNWKLPQLLQNLIDDQHAEHPRVLNVKLAVDLARHSAHGWSDAALPDDFSAIETLLSMSHETLLQHLGLLKHDEEHPPTTDDSGGISTTSE
jgi:HD-like signal output (HDOD) protein